METIIEKAIEGGYKDWEGECEHRLMADENGCPFGTHYKAGVIYVCDPLFWQALGEACGWKQSELGEDICFMCGADKNRDKDMVCESSSRHRYSKDEWRHYTLRFHEINLTEGWDSAVKYLLDLIK